MDLDVIERILVHHQHLVLQQCLDKSLSVLWVNSVLIHSISESIHFQALNITTLMIVHTFINPTFILKLILNKYSNYIKSCIWMIYHLWVRGLTIFWRWFIRLGWYSSSRNTCNSCSSGSNSCFGDQWHTFHSNGLRNSKSRPNTDRTNRS